MLSLSGITGSVFAERFISCWETWAEILAERIDFKIGSQPSDYTSTSYWVNASILTGSCLCCGDLGLIGWLDLTIGSCELTLLCWGGVCFRTDSGDLLLAFAGTSFKRSNLLPEVCRPVPKPTPTLWMLPLMPLWDSTSLPLIKSLVFSSILTLWCVSVSMTRRASGLLEPLLPIELLRASPGKYVFYVILLLLAPDSRERTSFVFLRFKVVFLIDVLFSDLACLNS